MPKSDIDYSNTIIYKITCKDPAIKDVYVGHTTNFVQRKHAHKQSCINEKSASNQCKLYKIMRENGGWYNWNMEIINFFNCKDHYEARIKEQEYFIALNATLNSIDPLPITKQKSIENIKPIENTKYKYYCDTCKVTVQTEALMDIHNQTKKHLNRQNPEYLQKKGQKGQTFYCEKCNFKCSKQHAYDRHLLTLKHQNTYTYLHSAPFSAETEFVCECGKQYVHRQSLYHHKKKCGQTVIETADDTSSNDIKIMTNMFMEVMKQNTEFKELIVDQHNKLMELTAAAASSTPSSTTQLINSNNTNNNTVINNKFNLNVFLNEKCKDAMNITDFVNSLQLQIKDLENTGEFGFAEGISRIFTRGLKELDVYKRPIHCSDLKREILHMKSEGQWEKTNGENPKLIKAIKQVANKNISMMSEWKKENPGCEKYNSRKNDTYLKMTIESMGPTEKKEEDRDFGKIIRSIAKDTIIEKEGVMLL